MIKLIAKEVRSTHWLFLACSIGQVGNEFYKPLMTLGDTLSLIPLDVLHENPFFN